MTSIFYYIRKLKIEPKKIGAKIPMEKIPKKHVQKIEKIGNPMEKKNWNRISQEE